MEPFAPKGVTTGFWQLRSQLPLRHRQVRPRQTNARSSLGDTMLFVNSGTIGRSMVLDAIVGQGARCGQLLWQGWQHMLFALANLL
jgi:hypothetical protein